jgi:hypothetical protein
MFKFISLKSLGAVAFSLSLLLGAVLATPVPSAYAKISYGPAKDTTTGRGNSYNDRNIDDDHDEMNESSENPQYLVLPLYTFYGAQEGKRTIEVGK